MTGRRGSPSCHARSRGNVDNHPHSFGQHPPEPADILKHRGDPDHLQHHGHGQHLDTRHLQGSQHDPAVQTGSQGPSSSPTGRKKIKIKKLKVLEKAEETIVIMKVDHLAGNKVEESREPYLSKPGPEAWQEPPAPPSTSSSWSVGSSSPSPGSFKGMKRGKVRSAAAPVVMGTIGPYHAHHLPDCRTSHCDEMREIPAGQSQSNIEINYVEHDVIGR